jgi:hypothetical protein
MPADRVTDRIRDLTTRFTLKLDAIAVALSIAAFCCRWNKASFPFARLFFCIALTPYFMQIFKLHMANSYLGPKVMMIRRMVRLYCLLNICVLVLGFVNVSIRYCCLLCCVLDQFNCAIARTRQLLLGHILGPLQFCCVGHVWRYKWWCKGWTGKINVYFSNNQRSGIQLHRLFVW